MEKPSTLKGQCKKEDELGHVMGDKSPWIIACCNRNWLPAFDIATYSLGSDHRAPDFVRFRWHRQLFAVKIASVHRFSVAIVDGVEVFGRIGLAHTIQAGTGQVTGEVVRFEVVGSGQFRVVHVRHDEATATIPSHGWQRFITLKRKVEKMGRSKDSFAFVEFKFSKRSFLKQ